MDKIQQLIKRNRGLVLLLIYGANIAALVFLLKFIEYQYFIRDLSTEVYVGFVAVLFTGVGIWIGLKIYKGKKTIVPPTDFSVDEIILKKLGISKREYEVLELIAKGYSNKEIGEKLFISIPTVKTHSSNLFVKLDVQRRTQAVKKARELKIIA